MLITFERKFPQSSYTYQNDHKSKGYPSKTSAFTMQKSDRGARIFIKLFKIRLNSPSLNQYLYWKLYAYSNIFKYPSSFYTQAHSQRMSKYILRNKFDMNKWLNIFLKKDLIQKNVRINICDQYIQIYSSHSAMDALWQSRDADRVKIWMWDGSTNGLTGEGARDANASKKTNTKKRV